MFDFLETELNIQMIVNNSNMTHTYDVVITVYFKKYKTFEQSWNVTHDRVLIDSLELD